MMEERTCQDCGLQSNYNVSASSMLCGDCQEGRLSTAVEADALKNGFRVGRSNDVGYSHLLVCALDGTPILTVGGNFTAPAGSLVAGGHVVRFDVRHNAPSGAKMTAVIKPSVDMATAIKDAIASGEDRKVLA